MFLKLLRRAKSGKSGDQGFALLAVIGVMVVVALVSASVGAVSVSSTGFTTSTGALNQSQAAADTAIDSGRVAIAKGDFYCTLPAVTGYSFAATVKYYDSSNTVLPCGVTAVGEPATAVITATGYANAKGAAAISNGDSFTRIAILDVDIQSTTVGLTKVVFSDGGWVMSNGSTIVGTGADIYSNGNVECNTSGTGIAGNIFIQGSLTIPNDCVVKGTAWAGTSVIDVQGTVGGNLFGVQSVQVTNSGFVGGSVASNGNIVIGGDSQVCPASGLSVKVCGSVVSFGGSVALSGKAIAGGVYAYGQVDLGSGINSTKVVGQNLVSVTGPVKASNVGGTVVGGYVASGGQVENNSDQVSKSRVGNPASSCARTVTNTNAANTFPNCNPVTPAIPVSAVPAALNYPTNPNVVAPPRESLPRILMETSGLAARWPGWTIKNVACEDKVKEEMLAQPVGSKLLIVSSCGSRMKWDSINTPVRGDLAIMAPKGLYNENGLTISSANPSAGYSLMWVVPSDSPGVSFSQPIATDPTYYKPACTAAAGTLSLNNATLGTGLGWFLYTPCELHFDNALSGFKGQMYAGTVTGTINNTNLTMQTLNVPGVTGATAGVSRITVVETARFDKRG